MTEIRNGSQVKITRKLCRRDRHKLLVPCKASRTLSLKKRKGTSQKGLKFYDLALMAKQDGSALKQG